MPGLRLFTDDRVRGPLIEALRQRGRDVVRAVDLFGQESDDAEAARLQFLSRKERPAARRPTRIAGTSGR